MDAHFSQVLAVLGLGLVLGIEHALDADHVVAVSTMASENKSWKASSKVGIGWGIGHTLTLLLVGMLVLGFKLSIPPRLSFAMEFCVGMVLVVLGVSVVLRLFTQRIHVHEHEHLGVSHAHPHSQRETTHEHRHRSLFVGMIHGLAGSSALMLLVLSTIPSFTLGIVYILIFGIGSIAGMFVISTLIGLPFALTTGFFQLNRWIRLGAGAVSMGLGAMIMIRVGGELL